MAGQSAKLNYSLQWRLVLILSLLITLMAAISGALAFRTAFHEAQDLQDTQLQHIALLLDPNSPALREDTRADINFPETASILPKPSVLAQALDSPYLDALFENNHAAKDLSQLQDGFHNYLTATRHWRLYLLSRHHQRIVVAQRTAYRNRIAQDSAISVIWPFLFLLPFLWLLSTLWIRRLFRATSMLSTEVSARNVHDLSPLSLNNVPEEIQPFITALNRLFSQLHIAIEHDKRFIGYAAHELRTPITALTLLIARFDEPALSMEEQKKLLGQIKAGIQRTELLLTQLLSLARAQQHNTLTPENTPLLDLLRELFSEILPLAEQKQQTLSVDIDQPLQLPISHHDLYTILKNLIVNAIHYTPANGTIRIRYQTNPANKIQLWIEDNGSGIAQAEREHVFEPFYRIIGHQQSGSGLGLTIVKTLCTQWQIDVLLTDSTLAMKNCPTAGLAVILTFKIQPPAQ